MVRRLVAVSWSLQKKKKEKKKKADGQLGVLCKRSGCFEGHGDADLMCVLISCKVSEIP